MKEPLINQDPRFLSGRALVQKGHAKDGAIDVFATLVEEARRRFGDDSVEAASCYYEYGNALFRAAERDRQEQEEQHEEKVKVKEEEEGGKDEKRAAAAKAAEMRLQKMNSVTQTQAKEEEEEEEDVKVGPVKSSTTDATPSTEHNDTTETTDTEAKPPQPDTTPTTKSTSSPSAKANNPDTPASSSAVPPPPPEPSPPSSSTDNNDTDDATLALELMENAWSILDNYTTTTSTSTTPPPPLLPWAQSQLPRILIGLGDVFLFLNRPADAADVYTRAIPHRYAFVQSFTTSTSSSSNTASSSSSNKNTLDHLQAQRLYTEAHVLVCEALLACPPHQHVVTTETKDVLVKLEEREEFLQGYYEKARLELQETVFLMGQMAAKGIHIDEEKENVCLLATMLMGVGHSLAEMQEGEQGKERGGKKAKTMG